MKRRVARLSCRFTAFNTTNKEDAVAEGEIQPRWPFGEGQFKDGGGSVLPLVEKVVMALLGTEVDEQFGVPRNARGYLGLMALERDSRVGNCEPGWRH